MNNQIETGIDDEVYRIESVTVLTFSISNILSSVVTLIMFEKGMSRMLVYSQIVNIVVPTLLILYLVIKGMGIVYKLFIINIYFFFFFIGMWFALGIGHHMVLIYGIQIILVSMYLLKGKIRFGYVTLEIITIGIIGIYDFTIRSDMLTLNSMYPRRYIGITMVIIGMILMIFFHKKAQENAMYMFHKSSITDDLTKLGNRYAFHNDLSWLTKECVEMKKECSVVYIDINDFKYINDTYGHKVGDKVLKSFARIMEKFIRSYDKIYRIGGDEFVILFYEMSMSKTIAKMRKICHEMKYEEIEDLVVEFSYGISCMSHSNDLDIDLIKSADQRMYEAKGISKKNGDVVFDSDIPKGIGRIGITK